MNYQHKPNSVVFFEDVCFVSQCFVWVYIQILYLYIMVSSFQFLQIFYANMCVCICVSVQSWFVKNPASDDLLQECTRTCEVIYKSQINKLKHLIISYCMLAIADTMHPCLPALRTCQCNGMMFALASCVPLIHTFSLKNSPI